MSNCRGVVFMGELNLCFYLSGEEAAVFAGAPGSGTGTFYNCVDPTTIIV